MIVHFTSLIYYNLFLRKKVHVKTLSMKNFIFAYHPFFVYFDAIGKFVTPASEIKCAVTRLRLVLLDAPRITRLRIPTRRYAVIFIYWITNRLLNLQHLSQVARWRDYSKSNHQISSSVMELRDDKRGVDQDIKTLIKK